MWPKSKKNSPTSSCREETLHFLFFFFFTNSSKLLFNIQGLRFHNSQWNLAHIFKLYTRQFYTEIMIYCFKIEPWSGMKNVHILIEIWAFTRLLYLIYFMSPAPIVFLMLLFCIFMTNLRLKMVISISWHYFRLNNLLVMYVFSKEKFQMKKCIIRYIYLFIKTPYIKTFDFDIFWQMTFSDKWDLNAIRKGLNGRVTNIQICV